MFTGLVQAVGRVLKADTNGRGLRLVVGPESWAHRPALGESISVSGCCLTLAEPPGARGELAFDAIPETLARTNLGRLRPGSVVNLERSLAAGDLIGGHMVQGHIDSLATVASVGREPEWRVRLTAPAGAMRYIVPKGAVALDGVSLTIAAVEEPGAGRAPAWFEVALIPTTLRLTTLAGWNPGDAVNVETDITARTVVHYLRHFAAGPDRP